MAVNDPDYFKKYYQKNREWLLEYQKEYEKNLSDEAKERKKNYQRKYRAENKEKDIRYREKNKERITKRAKIVTQLKRQRLIMFLPKWRIDQIIEAKMNEP